MYERFRCRGSSFKINFVNTNSTIPMIVGFYPYPDTITGTNDLDDAMSQPYSKFSLVGTAAGTSRSNILKSYMSTKKVYGLTNIDDAAAYVGLTGGTGTGDDPANEWVWSLYFGAADGAGNPTLMGLVDITYYIEFFDRKNQNIL